MKFLLPFVALCVLPSVMRAADAPLVPADWNPALEAGRVMEGLVNISAPEVKGAHDAQFVITGGKAYVVSIINEKEPGESAAWEHCQTSMAIVNIATKTVEKHLGLARSGQVFENETLPPGACFVPRIIAKDAKTLRCFFASESPGKRQAQTWYTDFDVERGAFDNRIHKLKLKTVAGTFDFQPQPFYEDAVAHGLTRKAKDFGAYLFDSFKVFEGRTYIAINNYAIGQNALAVLNDSLDTVEVIGHFNAPFDLALTEPAVNRLPDGTWMAIVRQESGTKNYLFTTSKDGRDWTVGQPRAVVPNGAASKPIFDRFHNVYYLGWQESTRVNDIARSVFNIEVSTDGENWQRKYQFATDKSFQYPTLHEYEGAIYLTVTQGDTSPSRKERIMFGRLE